MTTIFVAGSITIKELDPLIIERLKKIVDKKYRVVVGDANGVDSSFQRALMALNYENTTVFSSSPKPRNNLGAWPVYVVKTDFQRGTREFYTAKDLQMAEKADCGLMVWDCKSPGTLNNVVELLLRNKYSVVFVNKMRDFVKVKKPDDIDTLIKMMRAADLEKAEDKISLSGKLARLKNNQMALL
ncbi:hypothetical protein EXT66_21890 [Pectobacterium carotovorum subsp. carotovorum]|uniref:hypothetical protein n=1 Tax=Pectobacterium odoriferum TaxID=78398 RepID=UPI000CD1E257|nr:MULTISPECIES: hypothetical protein [Pectobacterium]MCL6336531.1 hypothetical protein [Pectobacterium carotovorum subsp. carotovorum]MCL6349438.1 hypothetical protein [Pectobacterium carotovorum subsp. carotovorum]MCL6403900.1 hypothetical protein [Pectobacterium carotovorum subsp. carotovorum]POD90566.1 hypothetical protein BV925_16270 [Pectobacterium odoriferum]